MKIKVYGIKNCDSVKKALKFFKDHNIAYDFFDFKEQKPTCKEIEYWSKVVGTKKLFNTRSTTYRNLKLKELNLDEKEKIEWLCKEPLLIKRPVVMLNNKTLVGFDLKTYKEELL